MRQADRAGCQQEWYHGIIEIREFLKGENHYCCFFKDCSSL